MKTYVFACIHNAGRSQMAAAWFNRLASPQKAHSVSAGTQPGARVHPEVLEAMQGNSEASAADEFVRAARAVLTRRVHNAPPERHESQWLTGWLRRVNSYCGG